MSMVCVDGPSFPAAMEVCFVCAEFSVWHLITTFVSTFALIVPVVIVVVCERMQYCCGICASLYGSARQLLAIWMSLSLPVWILLHQNQPNSTLCLLCM